MLRLADDDDFVTHGPPLGVERDKKETLSEGRACVGGEDVELPLTGLLFEGISLVGRQGHSDLAGHLIDFEAITLGEVIDDVPDRYVARDNIIGQVHRVIGWVLPDDRPG